MVMTWRGGSAAACWSSDLLRSDDGVARLSQSRTETTRAQSPFSPPRTVLAESTRTLVRSRRVPGAVAAGGDSEQHIRKQPAVLVLMSSGACCDTADGVIGRDERHARGAFASVGG